MSKERSAILSGLIYHMKPYNVPEHLWDMVTVKDAAAAMSEYSAQCTAPLEARIRELEEGLREIKENMDDGHGLPFCDEYKQITKLLSSSSNDGWISTEDQEPEYYSPVWAQFENGNVAAVWRASTVDEIIYTIVGTDIICPKPVRWTPLPKPPNTI